MAVEALGILAPGQKSDNLKVAAGRHTTVAASDVVDTGLNVVLAVVVSFDSDPADANLFVSAAPVAGAGTFTLKTFKTADGTDPTPAAATAFSKVVGWIAFGY